jgi:UPF0148 protein
MDKKNIENMAELLRSGNTMLNKSCPECNSPLFKNRKGEIFCPSCNRKVLIVDKLAQQEIKKNEKEHTTKKSQILNNKKEDLINQTINTLKEKILWLLGIIEEEQQTELITKYLTLLREMYEFLFFISDN